MVEKGIKSALAAGTEFHIDYFIEFMDSYRDIVAEMERLMVTKE